MMHTTSNSVHTTSNILHTTRKNILHGKITGHYPTREISPRKLITPYTSLQMSMARISVQTSKRPVFSTKGQCRDGYYRL